MKIYISLFQGYAPLNLLCFTIGCRRQIQEKGVDPLWIRQSFEPFLHSKISKPNKNSDVSYSILICVINMAIFNKLCSRFRASNQWLFIPSTERSVIDEDHDVWFLNFDWKRIFKILILHLHGVLFQKISK